MYNQDVEKKDRQRCTHNARIQNEWLEGQITKEDAQRLFIPEQNLQFACGNFGNRWSQRFRKRWGIKFRRCNTAGIFLEYDDPRMVKARMQDRLFREKEGVPLQLFLNYDQFWKDKHRRKNKKPFKARCVLGKMTPQKR